MKRSDPTNIRIKWMAESLTAWLEEMFRKPIQEWPDECLPDPLDFQEHIQPQEVRMRMSHGLDCNRAQFYKHHFPEKSKPVEALVNLSQFSLGDFWECWARPLIRYYYNETGSMDGWRYEEPMKLEADGIKGTTDGCLTNEVYGEIIVLDFKKTTDFKIKKAVDGHIPDMPWGHPTQAVNYGEALVEATDEWNAKWIGAIWPCMVVTKFPPWQFFTFWATRQELDPADRRWVYRQVPDMTAAPQGWAFSNFCKYCEFHDHCGGA